jgi:hypothetical protein
MFANMEVNNSAKATTFKVPREWVLSCAKGADGDATMAIQDDKASTVGSKYILRVMM